MYTGINVFHQIGNDDRQWVKASGVNVSETTNSSLNDKKFDIGVDASIKIKMVSLPLSLEGSASYHKNTTTHSETKSISYSQVYATGSTQLKSNQISPDLTMISKLNEVGATLVIIEIIFGSRANISYEESFDTSLNLQKIKGDLYL